MSSAATPRGSLPPLLSDPTTLAHEVESLATLDLHALRSHWRQRFRSPPPAGLTRPLLLRLLAYTLQARELGDLDATSVRFLDRLASAHARRRIADPKHLRNKPPPVPNVVRERSLMPGTLLKREHAGVLHRVVILADGFEWEGRRFQSLSEIARAITGTRWNGPRFFGLRDKTTTGAPATVSL